MENPIAFEPLPFRSSRKQQMAINSALQSTQIFKGYFQNIPICVHKRWSSRSSVQYSPSVNVHKKLINNIVFASQMSVHKNVLKLLGVCLEKKLPIAVYEWADHGLLEDCLLMHRTPSGTDTHQQHQPPLPWKLRLKIAAEVANVVVYLHTAFSRPVVHRDIKASHVLLDQQNVAKLCDFSLCIPIPEGEVRVEADCMGFTLGYEAPEYSSTRSCSEKADVFSFGILLLVLLTAQESWDRCDDKDVMLLDRVRHSVKDNGLADIVDPRILAEPFAGCPGMNQQLERFAELALSCAADREEDRPEMIDVEKQLWQMEQSTPNTCDTVISETSVHKNALKLLGVCLENKFPIAVYEWAEHGSLEDCLLTHRTPSCTDTHQQQQHPPPMPWKLRLKIAAEVANVVVYLHTAFSRPIVHRDIKASHVLLDRQNVAKLCDFSLCIPIPEGEVRVQSDYAAGTHGYLAPEYVSTLSCSEKADVFSFGILLLVLLSARRAWGWCYKEDCTLLGRVRRSVKDNGIADIVDPRILAEPFAGFPGMKQQLKRFAELALSCAADREEDRPEMIDVEKQLRQMEQCTPNTCGTIISEGMP